MTEVKYSTDTRVDKIHEFTCTPITSLARKSTSDKTTVPVNAGGTGGHWRTASCGAGQAMMGIHGRSKSEIDSLGFYCRDVHIRKGFGQSTFAHGGNGGKEYIRQCYAQSMRGLRGRHGSRLDYLEINCGANNAHTVQLRSSDPRCSESPEGHRTCLEKANNHCRTFYELRSGTIIKSSAHGEHSMMLFRRPYQVLADTGYCTHNLAIAQEVPGCGLVCSHQHDDSRGVKDADNPEHAWPNAPCDACEGAEWCADDIDTRDGKWQNWKSGYIPTWPGGVFDAKFRFDDLEKAKEACEKNQDRNGNPLPNGALCNGITANKDPEHPEAFCACINSRLTDLGPAHCVDARCVGEPNAFKPLFGNPPCTITKVDCSQRINIDADKVNMKNVIMEANCDITPPPAPGQTLLTKEEQEEERAKDEGQAEDEAPSEPVKPENEAVEPTKALTDLTKKNPAIIYIGAGIGAFIAIIALIVVVIRLRKRRA